MATDFSQERLASIKTQIAQMVKNTMVTLLEHFGPVADAIVKDIKDDVIPATSDALTRELQTLHEEAVKALEALKKDALAVVEKFSNPVIPDPPIPGESTTTAPIAGS